MTKSYCILFLFAFIAVFAYGQAPDAFQYQAVIAGSNGETLKEAAVSIRFSIIAGSATGEKVYIETQDTQTNTLGLVSLAIGKGYPVQGSFTSIQWINGNFFIETEVDRGSGFTYIGTQQLISVPYAKYADNADSLKITSANGKKWKISIDNNGNISSTEIIE